MDAVEAVDEGVNLLYCSYKTEEIMVMVKKLYTTQQKTEKSPSISYSGHRSKQIPQNTFNDNT